MSSNDYLGVYFSRLNHMGETTAERIRNNGIRSFERWMDESPFTVRNLSVERGIYFDGIIETNKDKEYEKILFLRVANDIPLEVGDIMTWQLENGKIEKWILAQEVKKVNPTYQTFWIIRCNYLLKWIDALGHLQQSWAYVVSSVDSKIKGNYRTWNNLITPQPNKYAEILMPRYPIDRATNFIVEEESWQVIEYDHTSVPGTIYLSLTENKVNMIYDDLVNNIADTDKLADYQLLVPVEPQAFSVGQPITPTFTLTKNGMPYEAEVELLPVDKTVAKIVNGVLTAVGEGETEITVQLVKYPQIKQNFTITVSKETQEFSGYIDGQAEIRLDRTAVYTLKGTKTITGEVVFSLEETPLAKIISQENNTCLVHANNKNKLGSVILTAAYDGKEYTKELAIIPLW